MNFAVIGNPVQHSLSPALHNWVFNRLGLEGDYGRIPADASELSRIVQTVRNGNLDGVNVTIPHKRNIMALLDEIDARAEQIDAVNCVVRDNDKLIGFNTDWYGFTMTLRRNAINVSGRTCVILGAGGSARSVAYALAYEDAEEVFVVNRTIERAERLVASFNRLRTRTSFLLSPRKGLKELLSGTVIVVNCTPVGMWPDVNFTPLGKEAFHRDQVLIDVIYAPPKTLFLEFGDAAGAQTVNGLDMFVYQGLASIDLWFGDELSQHVDVDELKKYLRGQLRLTDTT